MTSEISPAQELLNEALRDLQDDHYASVLVAHDSDHQAVCYSGDIVKIFKALACQVMRELEDKCDGDLNRAAVIFEKICEDFLHDWISENSL